MKLPWKFRMFQRRHRRHSCLFSPSYIVTPTERKKKNKERKIHSILTYKMENNRKGCINRDKNGCNNIQKVFKSYIETGERPEKYKREYKFQ